VCLRDAPASPSARHMLRRLRQVAKVRRRAIRRSSTFQPWSIDAYVKYTIAHDGHLHRLHDRHVDECAGARRAHPRAGAVLEEFGDRIIRCRVVIDQPNQHHREKHCRVEVVLALPGAELIASAEPGGMVGEDACTCVRGAFHAIRRQLVEPAQRPRHEIKSHPVPGHPQKRSARWSRQRQTVRERS